MVLVGEVSRIDSVELEHEADLEGEKPVCDLGDHVVAMGDSNTGFLGAVEWSCLVVAINGKIDIRGANPALNPLPPIW